MINRIITGARRVAGRVADVCHQFSASTGSASYYNLGKGPMPHPSKVFSTLGANTVIPLPDEGVTQAAIPESEEVLDERFVARGETLARILNGDYYKEQMAKGFMPTSAILITTGIIIGAEAGPPEEKLIYIYNKTSPVWAINGMLNHVMDSLQVETMTNEFTDTGHCDYGDDDDGLEPL